MDRYARVASMLCQAKQTYFEKYAKAVRVVAKSARRGERKENKTADEAPLRSTEGALAMKADESSSSSLPPF